MKTTNKSNLTKMSLVAALLLGTAAYAGKIIGVDAGTPYEATEPPTQYGFGGWNLDNINVKITDLDFVQIAKTFNEVNGTYDPMVVGDTFESDILDSEQNVLARLYGQHWPLGEPAGIKVVNNDQMTAPSGEPTNCIMTTSYLNEYQVKGDKYEGETLVIEGESAPVLVSGLLNTESPSGPMPAVCSSDSEVDKTFKVNMESSLLSGYDIATGYGKSFDLVFNLDTEDKSSVARRYQVFQEINNYTDMRLQGYKIQLLPDDSEGSSEADLNKLPKDEAELSLSLDMTIKKAPHEDGTVATFPNVLWGSEYSEYNSTEEELLTLLEKKSEMHLDENGFFDKVKAGFTQELVNDTTVVGGIPTLGSNYQDLFGLWLPSKWAPYGYYYDEDNNTNTKATLVAYWGTVPNAPSGTAPKWHKGNDYNETDDVQPFELVTAAELEEWGANPLYSVEKIEDTLNLNLNYVVKVGKNSTIGEKFIVRITPRVAELEDQTPPSYIDENGDYILPPEVVIVGPAPAGAPTANAGPDMTVVVNTPVTIAGSGTDLDGTIVSYEWKYNDVVIANTASFEYTPTISTVATLVLTVTDDDGLVGTDEMVLTITNEDGTVSEDPVVALGGGGGGCSYNPNSRSFDAMFLLMIALGVLYPLRRMIVKEEE